MELTADEIIKTKRLKLRLWKESDYTPFAEMCADPDVMQHFPTPLSTEKSNALIVELMDKYNRDGFTYYAVETLATTSQPAEFIGFTGILMQSYESPFTPNVDIGWRLKKAAWGKGYATEAAKACLDYAAETLKIKTIISVAAHTNTASTNVMKKIGMQHAGTFEHPKLMNTPELNPCHVYKWESPKKH